MKAGIELCNEPASFHRKLPFAVRLSRKTLSIIKQNICVSIAVKGVFLVLALFGYATLWMAIASDMGASLLVIANGLRTLGVRNANGHNMSRGRRRPAQQRQREPPRGAPHPWWPR